MDPVSLVTVKIPPGLVGCFSHTFTGWRMKTFWSTDKVIEATQLVAWSLLSSRLYSAVKKAVARLVTPRRSQQR